MGRVFRVRLGANVSHHLDLVQLEKPNERPLVVVRMPDREDTPALRRRLLTHAQQDRSLRRLDPNCSRYLPRIRAIGHAGRQKRDRRAPLPIRAPAARTSHQGPAPIRRIFPN